MSEKVLNPIVRWGQDRSVIYLTVDLLDVKDPEIQISDHSLKFKGLGRGAHGNCPYQFDMLFFRKVYPKQCLHNVTERCVTFHIQKGKTEDPWPRLLSSEQKPAWLKIDFDKWHVDDSTDEEETNFQKNIRKITVENRSKTELQKAQEDIWVFLRLAYLVIYNLAQSIAFTAIVYRLVMALVRNGKDGMHSALDDVGDLLITCQLAAFLEIINPIVGVVRTGVTAPLLQVLGRNMVLFIVVLPEKSLHSSAATFWLFFAWSSIEVVRYPFYVTSLLQLSWRPLTWLRYTLWLPFYPMGIFLEAWLILQTIPLVYESGRMSIALPNAFNISFFFPLLLAAYLVLMPAGGLYVLKHMWIQRQRRLATTRPKRD